MSELVLLPCPFCGGDPTSKRELRDGYQNFQDDPDAWAYFVICCACAAQGGWAKSESRAKGLWNMRISR